MGEVEPKEHVQLIADVTEHLESLGYLVGDGPVYETQNEKYGGALVSRLKKIRSSTSLYICGRADRFAVHSQLPVVFQWDAKTRPTFARGGDIILEALPFVRALHEWQDFRVLTLYVFRHLGRQNGDGPYEHAFWIRNHPPIWANRVTVPPRFKPGFDYFRASVHAVLPEVNVELGSPTAGSDDPYLILTPPVIPTDWRELIARFAETP